MAEVKIAWTTETEEEKKTAAMIKGAALQVIEEHELNAAEVFGLEGIEWEEMLSKTWTVRTAWHVAQRLNLQCELAIWHLTPAHVQHTHKPLSEEDRKKLT